MATTQKLTINYLTILGFNKLLELKYVIITALVVTVLAMSLQSKLIENSPEYETFPHINIAYNSNRDAPIEQFILRDQEDRGEFLLAAGAPSEMRLRLVPSQSSKVWINIEAIYNPTRCEPEEINKIEFRVSSRSLIDKKITLIDGQEFSTVVDLHQGDRLQVSFPNSKSRCAKALLTFSKKNKSLNYVMGFYVFWLLSAVALYFLKTNPIFISVGAGFNFLLILANLTLKTPTLDSLITTTIISIGFTGLLMMVCGLPIWRWLRTLLSSAFFACASFIPIAFLAYQLTFNAPGDRDSVHSILQSNLRQGLEFWVAMGGWTYSIILVVVVVLVMTIFYQINSSHLQKKTTFFLGSLFALFCTAQWSMMTDNTPVLLTTNEAINKYFHEFELFREMRDERLANLTKLGATTNTENQTLVVIIGESASKHHMSSYGYPRKTTPHTDKLIESGEMIRFDAAYSNHTLSNQTISRALTSSSNYNGQYWIKSPSVVNLAHAAGIRTSWVSNKPMYGAYDSHMSVIGTESRDVTYINTRVGIQKLPNQHDAEMIPLVKEAIAKQQGNQVVFMHLQGSHTYYCDRTPDNNKQFTDKPNKHTYGYLAEVILKRYRSVNCYDDSIHYTDQIIANIVEHLDVLANSAAVLYVPDHGESAFYGKAHNPSYFDFLMSDIPMFFWANDVWKDDNPDEWKNLYANRQKVFTNDHSFELISSLMGIESELLDHRNNIASSIYTESPKPTTLHGTKRLDLPGNKNYWQQKNIASLNELKALKMFVAQRSNTVAKIGQLQSSGIDSIEISVRFEKNQFMVGYADDAMTSQNLEDLLTQLNLPLLKTIMLTLIDFNLNDVEASLARLQYLDRKFELKQSLKIVSPLSTTSMSIFSQSGFPIVYSPDQNIGFSEIATEISSSGTGSTIALDQKQYAALKNELDTLKLLERDFTVHLRLNDDLSLASHNFIKELSNLGYLKDERISSISVNAWSLFQLLSEEDKTR